MLHLFVSYPLPLSLRLFTSVLGVEEDAILEKDFICELSDGSFPSIGTSLGVPLCFVAQILEDFLVTNRSSLRYYGVVIDNNYNK